MKSQTSLVFCMVLAIFASSSCFTVEAETVTADNVKSSPLYFPSVDKNHDGFLSRSEIPKSMHDLRVDFNRYDGNGDHRLSPAEYSNFLRKLAAGNQAVCGNGNQQLADPNCGGSRELQRNTATSDTAIMPPSAALRPGG